MMKVVHAVALIVLTIAAAHSYQEVRFAERTASFFRIALSEADATRTARGRRFDRDERGDLERPRRRARADDRDVTATYSRDAINQSEREGRFPYQGIRSETPAGESNDMTAGLETRRRVQREDSDNPAGIVQPRADMEQFRETLRGRSREIRRGGRHGRRRAAVSLGEVLHYTIIFAFATMFTYTMDVLLKRALRARGTVG